MKKIAADRNYRMMKKAFGLPDWFKEVSYILTQGGFKYAPVALSQILWDHHDALYNIYQSRGGDAAAETFIELYQAM